MGTPAFDALAVDERKQIVKRLYDYQHGICSIDEEPLDLAQPVDVDHIKARDRGGEDSLNNWGLAHASCNRSKGNRDLQLMRYLARFRKARKGHLGGDESYTVGTALSLHGGAQNPTVAKVEAETDGAERLALSWPVNGEVVARRFRIEVDPNNPSVRSITAMVPKESVFHDGGINPRSIVDLEPFIEEFYRGNPQLLPSLAHFSFAEDGSKPGKIMLFDGQHKAAAQIFLGNRELYLRIFINPNLKLLQQTNFGAHTRLAQIHFPMAIQDKVGHDLFLPALQEYLNSLPSKEGVAEGSFFSTLNAEDRGDMRSYFQGFLKFDVVSVVAADGGKFFDYVETVTARSKTKPLAYETVRKAIYNTFLCLKETNEAIEVALEMREKERLNLARLLRLFSKRVLEGQFDLSIGTFKLEERLATDPSIKDPHLRAYRLCRQAPLIVVMRELREAIAQMLSLRGRYKKNAWHTGQPLWADLDEGDWNDVDKMLGVIISHKVWIERNPANAQLLADNRQKSWEDIIVHGTLPGAATSVYDALTSGKLLKAVTA